MKRFSISIATALLFATAAVRGDGLLFSYDCDTMPGDPGFGFDTFDSCAPGCSRRLENGHFLLEWGTTGNLVNYSHIIAQPPDPPPGTLTASEGAQLQSFIITFGSARLSLQ